MFLNHVTLILLDSVELDISCFSCLRLKPRYDLVLLIIAVQVVYRIFPCLMKWVYLEFRELLLKQGS